MPTFEITYQIPDVDEGVTNTVQVKFEDTQTEYGLITAEEWAEDYAYSLADKGSYTIKRK